MISNLTPNFFSFFGSWPRRLRNTSLFWLFPCKDNTRILSSTTDLLMVWPVQKCQLISTVSLAPAPRVRYAVLTDRCSDYGLSKHRVRVLQDLELQRPGLASPKGAGRSSVGALEEICVARGKEYLV